MSIMEMSAQEILLFESLVKLAKEAKEAAELIKKHFSDGFGIGKTVVKVYHTDGFDDYSGKGFLTIEGTFRYIDNWWGGRGYDFACDEDGIYKMLRSCYLRENKLEYLNTEKFDCKIEHIDSYFREFIQSLKEKES